MATLLRALPKYSPMETDQESERIRELMRRKGIGQRGLAKDLGMTQATLNRKLTGKSAWDMVEYKKALHVLGAQEQEISGQSATQIDVGLTPIVWDAGTRKRLEDAARRHGLMDGNGNPNLEAMIRLFVSQGLNVHESSFRK
jgi:transcriptional regulator with XRE-family HTH domain